MRLVDYWVHLTLNNFYGFSPADHSSSPNSDPLSCASPIYKKQPKREAGSVPDGHGAASAVDGDRNEVIQQCQQLADSVGTRSILLLNYSRTNT